MLFPGRMEKPLQPQQAHGTRGMEGALPSCPEVCRDLCQASPIARAFLESKAERLLQWGCTKGFKNSSTAQRMFPFYRVAACPIPGHCSWQAEDTLPAAGMTPLRLACPHPQHLSQEKARQEHPCLLTALQHFETASLLVQTDPGGSFNSCSFTIKPGNQNRAIIHGGVFGNVISNSFWLADVQKDALLAASLCHERQHSAPILVGPRSPQWPHNTLKGTVKPKSGGKGGFQGAIILSFFSQRLRIRTVSRRQRCSPLPVSCSHL